MIQRRTTRCTTRPLARRAPRIVVITLGADPGGRARRRPQPDVDGQTGRDLGSVPAGCPRSRWPYAELILAEPTSGYVGPSGDEAATEVAVRELERRHPAAAALLQEAEAAPLDVGGSDATQARRAAERLNDLDGLVAELHLSYLRVVMEQTVRGHARAIQAAAVQLSADTILPGANLEAIVRAQRCACHREWGPSRATAPAESRRLPLQSTAKAARQRARTRR